MRTHPPIKVKPVYEGSNMWRTNSKFKYKCVRCTRFATHIGIYERDGKRIYMCPMHLRILTADGVIRKVEAFIEYKKYLFDMDLWKKQQQTAEQGTLL